MKKIVFFTIIFSLTFFALGFISNQYFNSLENFYDTIKSNDTAEDFSKNQLSPIDIASIIHVKNDGDLQKIRTDLNNYIFSNKSPTSKIPDKISINIHDKNFQNISNLKQIDELIINMKYDVNSVVYLFHPEKSNNKLIIYHEGHAGDFVNGKKSIEFFINDGYTVMSFAMPLLGKNNNPIFEHESIGKIQLIDHDQLRYLETNSFSPIQFFVEPIMISLNYLDQNYDFDSYNMVGISGGGWSTTLYSAMDERINDSFSIAGSIPIFMRNVPENVGDYEQILPELYYIANYLDLYILSSVGTDRSFTQIFIKNDPCCFGNGEFRTYEKILTEHITNLNGTFSIIEDDSIKRHEISDIILRFISNKIRT